MKVRYPGIVVFTLLIFSAPAFAQLGIFEKSADWYSPDNPRTTYKVAGSVTVDNGVYDIMGNGDDIWNNDDEGFFVYTEKSGDWRLSAHVNWMDPGSNEWSKVGVMIRENAADVGSRQYWISLRGQDFGDQVNSQWRPTANAGCSSSQAYEDAPDNTVAVQADNEGIWLRVTRISSIGMFISEWSHDGKTWTASHSTTLSGWGDTVAYGLAITSHVDDDYLVEAQVDSVVLEEAPSVAQITRKFDTTTFKKGQTVNATLNVFYTGSAATDLTITENVPAGFTISDISNNGTLSNGTITWKYTAQPGSGSLTYKATASSSYDPSVSGYIVNWSGNGGSFEVEGQSSLCYYNLTVGDQLFSFDFSDMNQYDQWEYYAGYWDIQDGLYYEYEDAGGPLLTLTGDTNMTDISVSVDAMGLVSDADWGIVFRGTDINNFYSWQFCNATLMFLSYVGGTRTEIYTEDFSEALNEWQHFQIIAKGDVFYLLFNGEIHTAVQNSSLTAGQVGLFGWVNSGSSIPEDSGAIAFDNLVVSSVIEATNVSDWSLY